jgi:glutamine synthetase
MKQKLEYVWLDGNINDQKLRSKTKIVDDIRYDAGRFIKNFTLDDVPDWNFDGSSTNQAPEGTGDTDRILKPVKLIKDPTRHLCGYLVMCEVMNPDGTPHESNSRALIDEYEEGKLWFGFEQEYFFINPDTQRPLGFPANPRHSINGQGEYYCGVGNINVKSRNIVERHMDLCIDAGLDITGVNGEVAAGQWEFQILGKGEKDASDSLWLARYLLLRLGETHGIDIEFHPKPEGRGDVNGSGMHTNFSSEQMRDVKIDYRIFDLLEIEHDNFIKVYGHDNDKRLSGDHETQAIDKFSFGVSDRSASIRIPYKTNKDDKGYLEDRRPASNADPYKVVKVLSDVIKLTEKK